MTLLGLRRKPGTKFDRTRSVAGAFVSSLGCGTLYVYSAYSTQLAERLDLTATQSSILGIMGPTGVALFAYFAGWIVDTLGLLLPCFLGTVLIGSGYTYLYHAYEYSISIVPLVAIALVLAGFGSTLTYQSCIKSSAYNFPHSRGGATSIPMSAFGLSAFLFSMVEAFAYSGDTTGFLKALAILTTALSVVCIPYMRVYDDENTVLKVDVDLADEESQPASTSGSSPKQSPQQSQSQESAEQEPDSAETAESADTQPLLAAPLLSAAEAERLDIPEQEIGGISILKSGTFWENFVIMGLVTGPGQMYIYCVGYCVRALTTSPVYPAHTDYTPTQIQSLQALQVALISLTNFSGRLISGFLSDHLLHKYGVHRPWLLVLSCGVQFIGSVLGMTISNVQYLWVVSIVVGTSYGLFFGVFPSIVTDLFGLERFSSNWGLIAVSQVLASYIYSYLFGRIYDTNSTSNGTTKGTICHKQVGCYSTAFVLMAISNAVGVILLLAQIRRHYKTKDHK